MDWFNVKIKLSSVSNKNINIKKKTNQMKKKE